MNTHIRGHQEPFKEQQFQDKILLKRKIDTPKRNNNKKRMLWAISFSCIIKA